MYCLVIAATRFEIASLLEAHQQSYLKVSPQVEIDFAITGVGLTATTYSLTRHIGLKRPDLIIQAGIAGSFDNSLTPGSVVAVQQDTIADQGVIEDEKLKSLFDLGLIPENGKPYENGWLKNSKRQLRIKDIQWVNAITTNEVTTTERRAELYREKYNPQIESLEGAALHYIALMEDIDFLQVRSISNYIGERDKEKWRLQESIANLNKVVGEMLSSL